MEESIKLSVKSYVSTEKIFFLPLIILLLTASTINAEAFKLPDTGQTTCYDASGNVIMDASGNVPTCPAPNSPLAQDGSYSINPPSYTDNTDGTVTDTNTGLTWQKQDDGTLRYWDEASSYCASLGTDWRLPTKKELITIVDYSIPYPGPTINPIFTGTPQNSAYWTSTDCKGYPYDASGVSVAWIVYFNGGSVNGSGKTSSVANVRCVRGGLPPSSFTNNGNGTVTDAKTGFAWEQGEPGYMVWPDALSYCENLELPSGSGQSDWRLPNIKELESITDDTIFDPDNHPIAIDTKAFPNANASNYWSSTSLAGDPYSAWGVNFSYGYVGPSYAPSKYGGGYVRCVRGGQTGTPKLEVSPTSYVFGNLTVGACSASPQIFTLSNTGGSAINVSDINTNLTVSNNKVFEVLYDWGPVPCNQSNPTIMPGDNCTVGVTFCPATAGSVTDNLVVTSNDPNSPANILMTGNGISTNGHLPITPVPSVEIGNPALDYGVSVSWATLPHNGIDYSSNLNDEVKSVGTGIVHRYTKATASRFGSISPDGRGPAIWVRYKLVSGEPVYVLYGHTATTWSDASTVVRKRFNFNCLYKIKWSPGDRINTGEAVGLSAPFYHSGVHQEHLHLSVFMPNRKKDGSYYEPPSSGWGYSNLNVREGNYINPKEFFNSYYLSDDI